MSLPHYSLGATDAEHRRLIQLASHEEDRVLALRPTLAEHGFEVHAIDHLVEPFTPARFAEVGACRGDGGERRAPDGQRRSGGEEAAAAHRLPRRRPDRVVPVQRIDYIEAQARVPVSRAGYERLRGPL